MSLRGHLLPDFLLPAGRRPPQTWFGIIGVSGQSTCLLLTGDLGRGFEVWILIQHIKEMQGTLNDALQLLPRRTRSEGPKGSRGKCPYWHASVYQGGNMRHGPILARRTAFC
jgi:hypothetical protein